MKFWSLFKKELRELMTPQALMGLVVVVLIFLLLGQVMGGVTKEMSEKAGVVTLVDQDGTALSRKAADAVRRSGLTVNAIQGADDAALMTAAEKAGHNSYLVIPKGYEAGIRAGKTQSLRIVSKLKSFALLSSLDQSPATAVQIIGESLSSELIASSAGAGADTAFLKNPVTTVDVTMANGRTDTVNTAAIQSFAMQQSIFIPIIVFILITFAAQLNAAAIATEKGDKTLETLLSAPVSRVSVLSAKMCASGVLSLIMAAVYMFAFSHYMGGMTGGGNAGTGAISASLQNLGLQLGPAQYALIGLQVFLTILIALAVSMILGALAKDVKAASSLIMPLMLLAMIPYFITMFADVGSLPLIGQILLYLIPFTHTFTASANLLFGNLAIYWIGVAYQVVLLVVVMACAVHVFSTDKIFTITLGGAKAKRRRRIL